AERQLIEAPRAKGATWEQIGLALGSPERSAKQRARGRWRALGGDRCHRNVSHGCGRQSPRQTPEPAAGVTVPLIGLLGRGGPPTGSSTRRASGSRQRRAVRSQGGNRGR